MLVGAGDEVAARLADVGGGADDAEDLVVLHHAGEAVGAEAVDVAGTRVVVLDVDHDLVLHAERARDDVLRELAALLLGEVRHRQQVVVDERVIAREQLDGAGAHAIATRVADVADVHAVLARAEHRAHHRRAHAVVLARAGRALEDLAVRHADPGEEAVLFLRQVRVEVERPGHVVVGRRLEKLADGLRRELGRHVPRAVPSHAVGDDKKVVLLEHYEGIFVVLTLETDIADACCDRPHRLCQPSRFATERGSLATPRGVKRGKARHDREAWRKPMKETREALIPP